MVNSGSEENKRETSGNQGRKIVDRVSSLNALSTVRRGKIDINDGRTLTVFERRTDDRLTLKAEPQVHQTGVFQLREDLHFPCDILQRTPHRALTLVHVLHRVHVSSTISFLHYANLSRNN